MNIFLTGGVGYIGSHTAVALIEAGHQVLLYDNLCNSTVETVERIEQIVQRPVTFVEGDIRDTEKLTKLLQKHPTDAVIHFAGLKAVGESVKSPLEYFATNVQGTISLLQAMKANSIGQLVFSSSATVYGTPQYLPIDEEHPTGATSPYGRTKLHIEEMLRDITTSDGTWSVACLRYFNPVGAHESGLIGESPVGLPNNLMPFVAQTAVGMREKVHVFGDDYPTNDGTGVRDFVHVMDVAEGHLAALLYLAKQRGWFSFNLGTGKGHTVLQMIRSFEEASGKRVPYEIAPRRAGDVAACFAAVEKARGHLGWCATRDLKMMCQSTYSFQSRFLEAWRQA